jgi:CHAD domain-containing protein
MAFRLKGGQPVSKQLSRIVRTEFERALDEIGDVKHDPEAVHDARKRVKKIRAVLHLLQSPLEDDYPALNRRLRGVAHQLSAPRDADAELEIMTAVRKHYPSLVTRTIVDGMRRGLGAKKRGTISRLHPARAQDDLRRSAKTLPRRIRRAADGAAVRAGVLRGYARARKAMRQVQTTPEDLGFHARRRRVKDHWYHVRLLEGVHRSARNRAAQLKRLETWLGDDHNLVLLRMTVLEDPSKFGDERATAVVLGCIEKYLASLRKRALTLGQRLFARKPDAFEKSIRLWQRAAR